MLALGVAAALLLTSATAMAQNVGTSVGGTTLGIPNAATPGISGFGIPLGATELGSSGLSPNPGTDLTGGLDAPPLAMPGAAGLGASPNGGLSPGVPLPQCTMPGMSVC